MDPALVISVLALALSGFAVVAQYYGIFSTRFEISKNDKVMIFLKLATADDGSERDRIIAGIIVKQTPQVITLMKTYHVDRLRARA